VDVPEHPALEAPEGEYPERHRCRQPARRRGAGAQQGVRLGQRLENGDAHERPGGDAERQVEPVAPREDHEAPEKARNDCCDRYPKRPHARRRYRFGRPAAAGARASNIRPGRAKPHVQRIRSGLKVSPGVPI
jgi:hypothetical protein